MRSGDDECSPACHWVAIVNEVDHFLGHGDMLRLLFIFVARSYPDGDRKHAWRPAA